MARNEETFELAARHLDRSFVDVLRILGFDQDYVSADGSYLYDSTAGRTWISIRAKDSRALATTTRTSESP